MNQAFGTALLALSLALSPVGAAASTNYTFYSVEKIKWGASEHQIALPRTFPSQADLTPSAVVSEAFHKLKSFRGAVYANASLQLDPNFGATGAVTVTLGEAAKAQLPEVVSEVYWTLTAAGAKEIRIPEVQRKAMSADAVPFGAALLTVQLWQVLPPGSPGPGMVQLSGGLRPAFEVRKKLDGKDKSTVAAVLHLLHSPLAFVRLRVVKAVAAMNLPKSEEAFVPLLRDRDPEVKRAVLKIFQGAKSKRVLAALETVVKEDPDAGTKSAAARILSAAGITKYAVIVLFEKLKDPDDAVVMDAIQKLERSGKAEVATALIEVLPHRNGQVRDLAMAAIVSLKNQAALQTIVGQEGIDAKYKNQGAKLLAAGTGGPAEIGLAYLLKFGPTADRVWAIGEVAKRRTYKLVSGVMAALAANEISVRGAAAKALGTIKDSKALAPLAEAVRKHPGETDIYEAAIIAVFGGLSVDEVIKTSDSADKELRMMALKSLSKFAGAGRRPEPRIVATLEKKLTDSDQAIRRSAAFALARIRDAGVVRSLVALKDDPDPMIREQVALAVTHSKHPQADAILLAYIEDSKTPVRTTAVDGLRIRGVKSALGKLKFHLKHRDVEMRRAVVRATVELAGPEGWEKWFPDWSQALYDLDPEVKIHAIAGIAYRPTDARVPSLLGGLATDPNEKVQLAALAALGKTRAKESIEYVARALFEGSKTVKLAALGALQAINLEECSKPVMDFVKVEQDEDLKKRANEVFDNLP